MTILKTLHSKSLNNIPFYFVLSKFCVSLLRIRKVMITRKHLIEIGFKPDKTPLGCHVLKYTMYDYDDKEYYIQTGLSYDSQRFFLL